MVVPLRIVGTSHISEQSARMIRRAVDEFSPTVIAVELDRRRLEGLRARAAGGSHDVPFSLRKEVGLTGWLFLYLGGKLQRKLGAIMKVEPGVDMLAAVEEARERQIMLALVDQEIVRTMRRLSAAFTARWKFRLLWDIISGPFRPKMRISLAGVPEAKVVRQLVGLLRERYPPLYEVLLAERNVHMCLRLDAIARAKPESRILLVVGAAHVDDLRERLSVSGVFAVE